MVNFSPKRNIFPKNNRLDETHRIKKSQNDSIKICEWDPKFQISFRDFSVVGSPGDLPFG